MAFDKIQDLAEGSTYRVHFGGVSTEMKLVDKSGDIIFAERRVNLEGRITVLKVSKANAESIELDDSVVKTVPTLVTVECYYPPKGGAVNPEYQKYSTLLTKFGVAA